MEKFTYVDLVGYQIESFYISLQLLSTEDIHLGRIGLHVLEHVVRITLQKEDIVPAQILFHLAMAWLVYNSFLVQDLKGFRVVEIRAQVCKSI